MNWALTLARKRTPKEGEASLYGVIVYSSSHGHLSRALQDAAYWAALDEASGPRWAIFVATAVPGRREVKGSGSPGTLSMLVSVWKEPAANKELLSAFQLESTEKPHLVVFTETVNGEILSAAVELDDSSVEAAFNSLKSTLTHIATVLEGMLDENRRVETRAFELAQERLWQDQQIKLVRSFWNLWQTFRGLLK